jgi:hypothetical protein
VQVLALIGTSLAGHGFSGGENSFVLERRADHSAQTSAKSDWLAVSMIPCKSEADAR